MSLLPFPVVVGVPRSGTTMLRLMLDSHPELAIPPETGFLLSAETIAAARDRHLCAKLITQFPSDAPAWDDFGIDATEFLAAVHALGENAGLADVLRTFYALYALSQGKGRSGDKTPMYVGGC